ncbi:uncharacterized protein C8Q71DRAFT_769707 [Rhodofomes roseus]|uniref:Ser-Thr-rich glycosyl-phosphatidyl-inositol-anchored membrane family-domain-containing protein n=1 Tax=Rhodofomes roseus TaxID=34475 RepID=A0ABQ8KAQ3_9APHY|nr:uncharacterized protein C8Q71DRAFT_769707 [Rhodofomes roseus]KAH9834591.1 hypothetical protein C8Q71DRAFT_769707 [Rhodofomes roseus]
MQHRLLSLVPTGLLSLLLAWCLVPLAKADYWNITEPAQGVVWANGQANLISWAKALDDGVSQFDIELQRLSTSGLSYVAHLVPDSMSSINVYIQDVPTGDDYYVMFVNYTHGLLYTASNTFTISDSADASAPSPDASAPTVTISGAPNPTAQFATTFASAGTRAWAGLDGAALQIAMITGALLVSVLCGAFSVL